MKAFPPPPPPQAMSRVRTEDRSGAELGRKTPQCHCHDNFFCTLATYVLPQVPEVLFQHAFVRP